ncbi:MAG: deoxyribodipyrimidine photo-lyase [Paracoccaceae bacterium]|nr:deoxyribodipyrimidine photo-lyase [Paracoccaceae bacterium]
MTDKPILWWVRKDLRLTDNPVLTDIAETGRPVVPVFLIDEVFETYGAAPLWRFWLGAREFAERLEGIGSRLVFRRGAALDVLRALVEETGADTVRWGRAYDPDQVARDKAVKAGLTDDGVDAKSVAGHLLFEPWTAETGTGGFYKVYTPFWKSVRGRDVPEAGSAPKTLATPKNWPASDDPADWGLDRAMVRGAAVVEPHLHVGEAAAQARLATFIRDKVADYAEARDRVAEDGTSGLSENLAWGEIGPRSCWHAGRRAMEEGKAGAEIFLKELVWREFAYHLAWHTPRIVSGNWREEWDGFPWNEDARKAEVKAWKRGRTGMAFVDAGMREMYVTGRMHNRARMIVASYLTKHLMCHWKIGLSWFADCLVDWDPASNAMGWQWSAGSGPDATPYFRVFNPETQIEKFDPEGIYTGRWIAEGQDDPPKTARDYFAAIPESWAMAAEDAYPAPIVGAKEGRERALAAYETRDF